MTNLSVFNDAVLTGQHAEWSTPQDFFNRLDAEFHFTLDAASSHSNAKCAKHFTKDEDGLVRSWAGERVWLNPPYSNGSRSGKYLRDWIEKAYRESRQGALVVCLVPAKTDSVWFHDYVLKGEIRFIRGRISFCDASNTPCRQQSKSVIEGRHGVNMNAPFASMVIIFWPDDSNYLNGKMSGMRCK